MSVDFHCIINSTVQVFLSIWHSCREYHKVAIIKNLKLIPSLRFVSDVRNLDLIFF